MDSSSFLLPFGMKPEDFERTEGPIQSDEEFVYEAWETRKDTSCPKRSSKICAIEARCTSKRRPQTVLSRR